MVKRCVIGVAAFLFLLLIHDLEFAYAAVEKIVVSNFQGGPTILRKNKELAPKIGMTCKRYDILQTGTNCQLDVAINGMIGCRLLPTSQCALEDTKRQSMQLNLTNGDVILNVNKLEAGSTFHLETPTAIAAVRGTQFWGRVDKSIAERPNTIFAVKEGVVEILAKSAGKTYKVKTGQALEIPKYTNQLPQVRDAYPAELAALEQAPTIKTEYIKPSK